MPDVSVPQEPFQEPVDARAQVLQGVAYFKSVFGVAPDGMWPSEGAVSDEALSIIQSDSTYRVPATIGEANQV
jgi:alpha-amylase/alpha-mannosidase (GH57 family)